LPPPPQFAPRLPSTPRMSRIDGPLGGGGAVGAVGNESARFPSFTMGSEDYFGGHEENASERDRVGGLGDITHMQNMQNDTGEYPRTTSTAYTTPESDSFSMPRPWDTLLDPAQMMTSGPTTPPMMKRKGGAENGSRGSGDEDDDEDEQFDIPSRLTMGPGAAAARLDLQRCTIRVHKQLVDQLATYSMKPGTFPGLVGVETTEGFLAHKVNSFSSQEYPCADGGNIMGALLITRTLGRCCSCSSTTQRGMLRCTIA
jgi:hypothetical protein